MTNLPQKSLLVIAVVALLVMVFAANPAEATHSWGNYHWARSSNPVALSVGDSVSAAWDGYLDTTISDWNVSSVMALTKVPGLANPKNCKPTAGRIEVCNSKYGRNGWLGIAQIWASGDHITQAVSKMNDTYFTTAKYNTPAWRQLVMCQEIAHDFGLDHQDEAFTNPNLGSCMDYTNTPSGPPSNEHPNVHDYEQLDLLYGHLEAAATASEERTGRNAADLSDPKEWGKEIRKDAAGRGSLYERDLGRGKKLITHVLWVDSIEGK